MVAVPAAREVMAVLEDGIRGSVSRKSRAPLKRLRTLKKPLSAESGREISVAPQGWRVGPSRGRTAKRSMPLGPSHSPTPTSFLFSSASWRRATPCRMGSFRPTEISVTPVGCRSCSLPFGPSRGARAKTSFSRRRLYLRPRIARDCPGPSPPKFLPTPCSRSAERTTPTFVVRRSTAWGGFGSIGFWRY